MRVVRQKSPLGSADAVGVALKAISNSSKDVLVLYTDTPFIEAKTIKRLIKKHRGSKASVTILTAVVDEPSGYGRVIKGENGKVVKVVEELDASIYEKAVREINQYMS